MTGENWFRTGAVAKALGVSPYRIRELARRRLITSEVRNGSRYISAGELARLKNDGLPLMPASSADLEESAHPEEEDRHTETRPPARNRLAQELYAEPSSKLVRTKERLIGQQLAADEKRVRREMRQSDREARMEDARERAAGEERRWRDVHIGHVIDMLPAEACASALVSVEYLLSGVPPSMRRLRGGANVGPKVEEIIAATLRPYREREEQVHAQETHRARIERAIASIGLPYGATTDDYDQARTLGRSALGALPPPTSLPPGTSPFAALAADLAIQRQVSQILRGAIRSVADRVSQQQVESRQRQAEEQRRLYEGFINLFTK
jgi:hypothetical protein